MLSRLTVAGVAVVGLAALGCSGKADSRRPEDAPRRVQVVKAEKRKIPRTVVAVGTLAAEDRAELGFKVPGRLARWNVDLGSRVGAQSVLAELDARDYELRRDRARAALEQARARLGLPVAGDGDELDPHQVGIVRQAQGAAGAGDGQPEPQPRAARPGDPGPVRVRRERRGVQGRAEPVGTTRSRR